MAFEFIKGSWGEITLNVSNKREGIKYKDVILAGRNHYKWDWNRTGTSHSSGPNMNDFQSLLTEETKCIIFSAGYENRLNLEESLQKSLKKMGLQVFYLNTKDAIDLYNELLPSFGDGLIGLFHSTC
jgi:hypothetical protein